MVWLVVFLFGLMWLAELPGMLQKRQWSELAAFAVIWAAGVTLTILIGFEVPVDGVNKLLRGIFEPLGKLVIVPPPD